jgi:ribosomal protein S6E (S10)
MIWTYGEKATGERRKLLMRGVIICALHQILLRILNKIKKG